MNSTDSDNDNIIIAGNYDIEINLPTFIEMSRKAKHEEDIHRLHALDKIIFDENEKMDRINESGVGFYKFNKTNGYVIAKMQDYICNIIDKRVTDAYNNCDNRDSLNNILVGNIEKQYALPIDDELEHYVAELCNFYISSFPGFQMQMQMWGGAASGAGRSMNLPTPENTFTFNLEIVEVWANYMKKTEFNPVHHHAGLFSFVIWHKIPYDIKTEILNSPSKRFDGSNTTGSFEFIVPAFNKPGMETCLIMADKKYEGAIIVFPSYINHVVWPFYTSDEYRISLSGNVKIKNSLKTRD